MDPNPSHTVQSKRRLNSAMSRSLASLPNATRNGLSRSSGCSGVASTYAKGLPT
ncbi:acyl-CoA synthetase domain protein [Mycobacterium xenopi 3993]|nr:acyl-CoA synthetase domain protein [Mycobacterium xenopi 3993]